MPEVQNPFVEFFLRAARRQLIVFAGIGALTVFFTLYGYGLSWISFWVVFGTAFTLGLFYSLTWFWSSVFQSMFSRGK